MIHSRVRNQLLMKFKQLIILFFFVSFSIYNLCPVLMQGNCGFSQSDSVPIAEGSQHCQRETAPPQFHWDMEQGISGLQAAPIRLGFKATCCVSKSDGEEGSSNAPQRENRHAENCCIIGLELLNPSKSDPLNQLLITTFSVIAAIPSPSAVPPLSQPTFRHVHPVTHYYDYFPVHQISLRGPPLFLS